MSDTLYNLHSSLPIEYKLKYGTACGYLNVSDSVGDTLRDGVGGINGAFTKEKFLCDFWINPSPVTVDCFNPLLVGLNRR